MQTEPKQQIVFEHTYTSDFRTQFADGVFGGPTTNGKLFMDFYNEMQPVPGKIVYEVGNKSLGNEVNREMPTDYTRQFFARILMDMETAERFAEWLNRYISDNKNIGK